MGKILAPLLLGAVFLVGCTYELWTAKPSRDTYQEQVSSVLISNDGKKLVVIGKDFHYIFDAPQVIVKTLDATHQKYVTAILGEFSLDETQKITGDYTLRINENSPEEAKRSALDAGFYQNAQQALIANGVLVGTRYSAGNVKIDSSGNRKLNKEYYINVSAPQDYASDLAKKALLTPVTVLADGTLMIAGAYGLAYQIGLGVIAFPIYILNEAVCGASKKC